MAGRTLWAGLHLLDHQLIDRDGRLCGNVDDLELSPSEDGHSLFVTAIYSGPGALATRLGHPVLGRWLERLHNRVDGDLERLAPIPFGRVTEVGSAIKVDASHDELPTAATDKWVGDHIIGHIPGAHHAVE